MEINSSLLGVVLNERPQHSKADHWTAAMA
jgi:hypothetical protein